MKRKNNASGTGMLLRSMIVSVLLLWSFGSQAVAQGNDKMVVIKKNISRPVASPNTDVHYLAHVKDGGGNWVLQDATTFGPDCIWYTGSHYNRAGTNHNYYFIDPDDPEHPHFLSAPMTAGGTLSLSDSKPATYVLSNTDLNYYYYNWDKTGIARGHQITGIADNAACTACGGSWDNDDQECWEVYWVEYDQTAGWRLTSTQSYGITDYAARAYDLTVTENPAAITSINSGGLTGLTVSNTEMTYNTNQSLSASVTSLNYFYDPAYTTYAFTEIIAETEPPSPTYTYASTPTTIYMSNGGIVPGAPSSANNTSEATSYKWTLTGEGAQYLSFVSHDNVTTSDLTAPTIYYDNTENLTGHKTATLTVTVTFGTGASQVSQTRSVDITVKTDCKNPAEASAPVVTFEDVTVTWNATAEKYKVEWKKSDQAWGAASQAEVEGSNSYTITGLDYNATYDYRVTAFCDGSYQSVPESATGSFTTKETPGLLVYGSVFGGGRMANVGGKTEVIIINCDTIGAVYGGNDIAGEVEGADGSTIVLGVNAGDTYSSTYNSNAASTKVNIGSVYGGGNGYYLYGGADAFVGATTSAFAAGDVKAVNIAGHPVVVEDLAAGTIPTIVKTNITLTNNAVKVDSLFGGAKNAFLTLDNASQNGATITVNGGTVYALFGGNNFGGTQGSAKHHIDVNGTTTYLTPNVDNNSANSYGRTFGIRYLFGGGNKVAGSTTEITVAGGQVDTLFGGGNNADVAAANITVSCSLDAGSGVTFGNTYSSAISSYSSGITVNESYPWNGTGVYNVRTLFGGNNAAAMSGLPTITLTSGSVGTAYGGGNAGNMLAQTTDDGTIAGDFSSPMVNSVVQPIYYGTHVVMNSADMLVDYLYGGCQKSDVLYSTWVEVQDGHVGTVYGGCNISGDVGSHFNIEYDDCDLPGEYQYVKGATYVKAEGGTIYGNLFAGSNGFYHCNDGVRYISGIDYDDDEHYYIGLEIPTHNETNVDVSGDVTVKGNVYAGGNLAPVGFISEGPGYVWRVFVGMATIRMSGGTVEGSVYGGGNMASIYGSNEVFVSGGKINGALYGGNDRSGQVAQITNRELPAGYDVASDGKTSLKALNVHTYVEITGRPDISTVYGGGNGAYDYENGDAMVPVYCDVTDQPIQTNTFVDINLDGYKTDPSGPENGGHIETVYGGGNGVTVTGGITVLLNVQGNGESAPEAYDHVGTVFGGNNMGDLAIVPDIILLKGQVGTVYGGCNQGAMVGGKTVTANNDLTYPNVGSLVHLRKTYLGAGSTDPAVNTAATVSTAVYGGCRMNGVTNNSLVLVEGGNHSNASIFGGSDISGTLCGISQVVVNDASAVVGTVYGGGNGNYYYDGSNAYLVDDHSVQVATTGDPLVTLETPYCADARVYLNDGTATHLYAGGYAGLCGQTLMQVDGGMVTGNIYGGGNQAGTTTSDMGCGAGDGTSTVTMNGGAVRTGIYGGCNASGEIAGDVTVNINKGTVGTDAGHLADGIFGGGFGDLTTTGANVTVKIGNYDAASAALSPIVYGDIYGGSALGLVNSSTSDVTTVNVFNGTITGNIYGGGLGSATLSGSYINYSADTNEATVKGTVHVNIGNSSAETYSKYLTINGKVFGCNNLAGSPKGEVFVDVYRTAHSGSNICPTTYTTTEDIPDTYNAADFAIAEVYGGGNLAHYKPSGSVIPHVHIHHCDNTIGRVYGGGNAASTPGTDVLIDGGRMFQVFAGGNGKTEGGGTNPGADVDGDVAVTVVGGIIYEVFGGSNTLGTITGSINIIIPDQEPGACTRLVQELYGGGNEADIDADINLVIPCGTVGIADIYGGANNANVGTSTSPRNITLTIEGGVMERVFGGNNAGGTIYGNVTVNILGGDIHQVFGGSNLSGDIKGTIQVNVNVDSNSLCLDEMDIDYVYGGGFNATYNPETARVGAARLYPEVNIIHGKVNNDVFGGGLGSGAIVTGNPVVTVGSHSTYYPLVGGDVYGGGSEAQVTGNTKVKIMNKSTVEGNVYGGGNAAVVTGKTDVSVGEFQPEVAISITGTTATLTLNNDAGTVYYTLDGTTPTTSSTTYSSPVTVSDCQTVKAIGVVTGYPSIVTSLKVGNPEVSVNGSTGVVTITVPDGVTCRYSVGAAPDAPSCSAGTVYNPAAKPTLSEGQTIKVIAYKAGYEPSKVIVQTR